MPLLKQIPIWLKCIFWFFGILQLSQNNQKFLILKFFPILFWCYYFVITVRLWIMLLSSQIDYMGISDILQYTDNLSNILIFISMITLLVFFYKRNGDLQKLFTDIDKLQTNFIEEQNSSINWHQIIYLFIIVLNLVLLFFGLGVLIDVEYHLTYYLETILTGLDVIFTGIILDNLKKKFYSINTQFMSLREKHKIYQIEKLAHLHYQLVTLVNKTNQIFGLTILFSTTAWFTVVINEIYFLIYIFSRYFSQLSSFYWTQFPLIAHYCFWIYFQIRIWDNIQEEVRYFLFERSF